MALPAYTRVRDGQWHQVVVGPYLTTEEASAAQHGLAQHGFTDSSTLVERAPFETESRPEDRRAVLLRSGDRTSLVLQLAEEPKKVLTRQVDDSTLEIDLGPVVSEHPAARLNALAGVPVISRVDLQNVMAEGRDPLMRARIALRGETHNDVRVVGRRVYVDFVPEGRLEPASGFRLQPADLPPKGGSHWEGAAKPESAPAVQQVEAYDAAIKPVLSQLTESERFLLSATATPTPEVLAALHRMMSDLHASARAIEAPAAAKESHVLLLAAISQARRAVEADFSGDRVMQARQAIALWAEAAQRKES
jgi:hypothetical protein